MSHDTCLSSEKAVMFAVSLVFCILRKFVSNHRYNKV
uniref:Uncharacterized protein n=1 Tax=Arundo donax TaxID=35708 RepID=A0A0A8YA16_ARUDO